MKASIKELRYFVTVADKNSLTAAAVALNVSQPSISLTVQELEQKLGVKLFVRHHAKGVTLTSAGVEVLREARKLLAQVSDLEARAYSLGEELQGTLTVGCLAYLVPRYLARILKSFALLHPQIQVGFTEVDQGTLVEQLMSGEIELALTYTVVLPNHVETEILCEFPPYVIVSADHPMANKNRINLRALASEPMVLLDLPTSRDYYRSVFSALNIVPNLRYRSLSMEGVRSLVANGLGYSVINQRSDVTTSLDGQKFVRLEINERLPPARVTAVYPPEMKLRKVTEVFLEHVRSSFAAWDPKLPNQSKADI